MRQPVVRLYPWLVLALLVTPISLLAQLTTLDSVTSWVLRKHPLAIAADAVQQRGPAELMRARGGFDPVLRGSYDRKDYLGTEYFEYGQGGIDWQSPYAFKIEGGREWSEGEFAALDRNVPRAGQAYLSVKLPLIQGLLRDKYRIGVEQAQTSIVLNEAAAEVIRNELRYDVAVAYTQWAYTKTTLQVYEETERLLREYLRNTRDLLALGEKPAVDTLEASVYLVDQRLVTQQAAVEAQIAAQNLAALYFPLGPATAPDLSILLMPLPTLQTSVAGNPELAKLRGEAQVLELERRLKREYLKPKLDVGYSILGDGFELAPNSEKVADRSFLTRAYKVGAEFRYPIFNRKARGDVQLAEIKLAETGAKLETKRQQLVAKANAYRNAALNYESQLGEVTSLIEQAEGLLQAERELFAGGEGTQFLLNQRAQSLQKAQITRAKLLSLRAKAIWSWRQALGVWQ